VHSPASPDVGHAGVDRAAPDLPRRQQAAQKADGTPALEGTRAGDTGKPPRPPAVKRAAAQSQCSQGGKRVCTSRCATATTHRASSLLSPGRTWPAGGRSATASSDPCVLHQVTVPSPMQFACSHVPASTGECPVQFMTTYQPTCCMLQLQRPAVCRMLRCCQPRCEGKRPAPSSPMPPMQAPPDIDLHAVLQQRWHGGGEPASAARVHAPAAGDSAAPAHGCSGKVRTLGEHLTECDRLPAEVKVRWHASLAL
jgi:hypothetical protein